MKPYNDVITNPAMPPTEGFGTQYLYIATSIFYAEAASKQFIYTPFQAMAHNYDNDPDFLTKKEKLIHLIDYFPINHDLELQKRNQRSCGYPLNFDDLQSPKLIKTLFFSDKKKERYFGGGVANIAIHIRKSNAHDTAQVKPEISDHHYCLLIDKMKSKPCPLPVRFHIYSQGTAESFKMFESEDLFLHLNESIEDTFTAMAFADVLVTAPSCFSYAAGLLSNSLVYYFPAEGRNCFPHWQPIYFQ